MMPKEHEANSEALWRTLLEGMAIDVPPEAWSDGRTDGAEQHDHYLYGSPKKPTRAKAVEREVSPETGRKAA